MARINLFTTAKLKDSIFLIANQTETGTVTEYVITGLSLFGLSASLPEGQRISVPEDALTPADGDLFQIEPGATSLVFPPLESAGPTILAWDRLTLSFESGTQIRFQNLQVSSTLLPGVAAAGDLILAFDSSETLLENQSSFHGKGGTSNLTLKDLYFDDQCFGLEWTENDINTWLRQLLPHFRDEGGPAACPAKLRILHSGAKPELRLAWQPTTARSMGLPGVTAKPLQAGFSVVLQPSSGGALDQMTFAIDQILPGQTVTAASAFAWTRDQERELQNQDKGDPAANSPFQLSVTPPAPAGLALMSLKRGQSGAPTFFQQLDAPLDPIDFTQPDQLHKPSDVQEKAFQGEWQVEFSFTATPDFTFPFLKRDGGEDVRQSIRLGNPVIGEVNLGTSQIHLVFPVTVSIGTLVTRESRFACDFDYTRFALQIDHQQGIRLYADEQDLLLDGQRQFLGLDWHFRGVQKEGGPAKYHFFTLATSNYNYALQQAPGARFSMDYTRVSHNPIVFLTQNFTLTPKGIQLAARVSDDATHPVRLNGLETDYVFHSGIFQIEANRIADFSIGGSGPLPPALVGDGTADITMQFTQEDFGNLSLVACGAQLEGDKPLHCRETRFQFAVDSLALKFVTENSKYYLYYTLSGNAQFVLAPGDDLENPLALLPKAQLAMVDCPYTGDARIVRNYVEFLAELPEPISFSFLGCFEMEVRAIGFLPQAYEFDDDPAMMLTGQVKFAQGTGDVVSAKIDLHRLLIGYPGPGRNFPEIFFKELSVEIAVAEAFKISATVELYDTPTEKGFTGEGTLEIEGLPTFAASFGFLRVRYNTRSAWEKAWFIYLEIRKVSLQIPVIEVFIREVGLGFGYRFTLVAIKEADKSGDIRELLASLKELSRTQGDLSKRDKWAVDLERPGSGGMPHWTIVFRAMISQTSASLGPLEYNEEEEKELPCVFLLDAIVAVRSDLTFFMAVRGWLYTNYAEYVSDEDEEIQGKPLVSGFVLISPRQKRLLANVSSNPDGYLGNHPPLPDFVRTAIQASLKEYQISMTMLIEPGLFHYELGWPNVLRWRSFLGPFPTEYRGGLIFRISRTEMVLGISFQARSQLAISAGVDLGLVGASVSARADIAFGARFIGVLSLVDPAAQSALYGAIGLEANIRFTISFWIKIPLIFYTLKLSFHFSLSIGFTVGLEIGMYGLSIDGMGLRGHGTLSVSCMGHSIEIGVYLGFRAGNVDKALNRTRPFLNVGLEAGDVESVPGLPASGGVQMPMLAGPPPARETAESTEAEAGPLSFQATTAAPFSTPAYTIFVVRPQPGEEAQEIYFVLMPAGENESGFLPPPPDDETLDKISADFTATLPEDEANMVIERFDPSSGQWIARGGQDGAPGRTFEWKANWEQEILQAEQYATDNEGNVTQETPTDTQFKLKDYLVHAYITEASNGTITASRDPMATPAERSLEDIRVQNPTENAFEAAVRGAVEQFQGSPYFKKDPNSDYEKALSAAFREDTTIYSEDGNLSSDPQKKAEVQMNQQARQLRGMVIHDFVSNVQQYAASPNGNENPDTSKMIPFQMGLVFRIKGNSLPDWLDNPNGNGPVVTIQQRTSPQSDHPDGVERPARPFNVSRTDFAVNSPQFQRVRHFTDANTIAITWDLSWDANQMSGLQKSQADPNHHLMHYQVRRRSLSGSEREVVNTIKPTQALHRETKNGSSLLTRLKPRFQIVDHFNQETQADQAALPAEGRSYLYTITPIDFAGHAGRPLTLVATRYPNQPPQVPVDAELIVTYQLKPEDFAASEPGGPSQLIPELISPSRILLEWPQPLMGQESGKAPVERYRLIFRKSPTLPIGSYGQDSVTQGPREKSLPTSNARPRPTDARIEIPSGEVKRVRRAGDQQLIQTAEISLSQLQSSGLFPSPDGASGKVNWRPESWRVYLQAVSKNGVPSALSPVKLVLRTETLPAPGAEDLAVPQREERSPAEIEWLPKPLRLPVLPPEDQRAITGSAQFPMPQVNPDTGLALPFDGTLDPIEFRTHPLNLRMIRFRWNQGPSNRPDYPLDLNGGFHLLELDVDAHTDATFNDPEKLAKALREVQEIQMLPAEDLTLTPGSTLRPSQWEAWYPSSVQRRYIWEQRTPAARPQTSQGDQVPWFSWRESFLDWPEWSGLTVLGATAKAAKTSKHHPFLEKITNLLSQKYAVGLQAKPPLKPMDLKGFMQASAPASDPYGWGLLQGMGLSIVFSLRQDPLINQAVGANQAGKLVAGQELLTAVNQAVQQAIQEDGSFTDFLHVELLVQPGKSKRLPNEQGPFQPESLLGIVQISLRPRIRQYFKYWALVIQGPSKTSFDLLIGLQEASQCSLINQGDPASGQVELNFDPNTQTARLPLTLPMTGQTFILLRTPENGKLSIGLGLNAAPDQAIPLPKEYFKVNAGPPVQLMLLDSTGKLEAGQREGLRQALSQADKAIADLSVWLPQPIPVIYEFSAYFAAPDPAELARNFTDANKPEGAAWQRLKRYLEATNSTDLSAAHITVETDPAQLKETLPDMLAWLQRFLDYGGGVTFDLETQMGTASTGPWMATAYPRASSPAYASPDPKTGRLQYDLLLSNPMAHNYRYYIRPYGRYDELWQNLRQSARLFPDPENQPGPFPEAGPDPEAGGLDVVLERTRPIDKPVILSSRRLDPIAPEGQPVPPGKTWEVIVARHPEQALSERNQTLARQLAYRHLSFTLLRRFAFDQWKGMLEQYQKRDEGSISIEIRAVENMSAAIPSAYPERPDHIRVVIDENGQEVEEDLPSFRHPNAPVDEDDLRSLDLPERLGAFQQGALAIQWQALPFYYEHRLLVVAHTASTVSPVNEITQRDFEYRTPDPCALVAGEIALGFQPPPPFENTGAIPELRAHQITIPLKQLWDSLPDAAQERWKDEAPQPGTEGWLPASLPDLEVVYQVVLAFGGNIEVQAEYSFDPVSRIVTRQLGKRLLSTAPVMYAPEHSQEQFSLEASLVRVAEYELKKTYQASGIDPALRKRVAFQNTRLSVIGGLSEADAETLVKVLESQGLEPADRLTIQAIPGESFSQEPVTSIPELIPEEAARSIPSGELNLVWEGAMTESERQALVNLPGDELFKGAVQRLANYPTDEDTVLRQSTLPGPDQPPAEISAITRPQSSDPPPERTNLIFETQETTGKPLSYTGLTWVGPMTSAQSEALQGWASFPAFAQAVSDLMIEIGKPIQVDLPPIRPQEADLPAILTGKLMIGQDFLMWNAKPSENQALTLASLEGDQGFVNARQALEEAIRDGSEAQVRMPAPPPRRPTQEELPASIREQLTIANEQLSWKAPKPTSGQESDLKALTGDSPFLQACDALLAALSSAESAQVPMEPPLPQRPSQTGLPPILAEQLEITETLLTWRSPQPSEEEKQALQDLRGDEAFTKAIQALLSALTDRSGAKVDLEAPAPRPSQSELPEALKERLTLGEDRISLANRLSSEAEIQTLTDMSRAWDPGFQEAMAKLLDELQHGSLSVPFNAEVRPEQASLPQELKERLLIGKAWLTFNGIMRLAEAQSLLQRFDLAVDQASVRRLYAATLRNGMQGRTILIRARRGSARISQAHELKPTALNETGGA